jgi:HAE1 family hydrophobic/amphiphilic exporter-1
MVIFLFLKPLRRDADPGGRRADLADRDAGRSMYAARLSRSTTSRCSALTLAVGLVVDDAIVMLENIVRHMEMGRSSPPSMPRSKGSSEIGFTIMSITLSLVAVFIPVLLHGRRDRRVFAEFAVVVAVAISSSAFVSLTLTPMLCARLKAHDAAGHGAERRQTGSPVLEARLRRTAFGAYRFGRSICVPDIPPHSADAAGPRQRLCLASAWLVVTMPKGFFPTGGYRPAAQVATEGAPGHLLRGDGGACSRRSRRSSGVRPMTTHVASTIGSGGQSSSLNAGRHLRRAEAEGAAPAKPQQMLARPAPRSLAARCRASPPTCRRCRTSTSARAPRSAQYL